MEKFVNKILKVLKEHVKQNIKEIQYNQDEINSMLTNASVSLNSKELDYKYELNKELLEENEDFILLQMQMNEFMEKYSHLFTADSELDVEDKDLKSIDKINFLNMTVTGKLVFDSKHPQFNNPQFFQELLEYYQELEDYEKCDELLKIRDLKELR